MRRTDALRWISAGAAAAALAAAVSPAVDGLADRSFAGHMLQHMLLVYVAPPLLLLARPASALLSSLPPRAARKAVALLRTPFVEAPAHPLFAWSLFAAVLWGAHFSGLYEAALDRPAVHAMEHIAFLGAGIAFWYPIVAPPPAPWSMRYPLRMAYVFATIPLGAFLGLALNQTRYVLYPHYAQVLGSEQAALADQQAGGAVMWLAGGCVLFVTFMLLGVAWSIEERRAPRFEDTHRPRYAPTLWAVVACAALSAVAKPALASQTVDVAAGADGRLLFAQHCASCHGAHLEGTAFGPPLGGVAAAAVDFYVGTGRMPKQEPRDQSGRSPVRFTPAQIAALVRYVTSVSHGPPALPEIRPGDDLADGKRAFIQNCAACHGAAGSGDSVGYGWVAPSLRAPTPLQIAEAVRIGPAVMPRFDAAAISDRQLGDIIAYVQSLRGSQFDAGGFDLGYEGPVAEGAVAWVIGLGIVILFIRRIGTDA